MIFTDRVVSLENAPPLPRFFATSLTNEKNVYTYLHCLFIYEPINPIIIGSSKSRMLPPDFFDFVANESDNQTAVYNFLFTPVVICIKSKYNFIDFFRHVLKCLYLHMSDLFHEDHVLGPAMNSLEFLKYSSILLNDLIMPPNNIQFSLRIGKHTLLLPYESTDGMVHNESAVAILVDLIDIGNIIDFWEIMILNKHAFLMSCNEYLLFIIIEGFKSLLFPLTWTCNIIPVLSPHLIDFIECPVPILIGLNSTRISKETALSSEQDKVILDIDSNMIYCKPVSTICQCVRSNISKKLQLIKTYYYTTRQRLANFRNLQMEKSVGDADFVANARRLLVARDAVDRENLFVDLVKQVFFSVFLQGLETFEDFISKGNDQKIIFDKHSFIDSQGYCRKCKDKEFWRNVVDTSNFEQFIGYYGKFDQSFVARFTEIVKKNREGRGIGGSGSVYSFDIKGGMAPKNMLEILTNGVNDICVDSNENRFKKKSAVEILKELNELLSQNKNFYENSDYSELTYSRRSSFTLNPQGFSEFRRAQNTFYGCFGIIRCISTIFSLGNSLIFSKLSCLHARLSEEILLQASVRPKKFEAMVIKLLYLLKQDETLSNYQELLNLLFFINRKCPEILPKHIAVFILNRISKIDPDSINTISSNDGILGEIAKVLDKTQKDITNLEKCYSKDDLLRTFRRFRTSSMYESNKMHTIRI